MTATRDRTRVQAKLDALASVELAHVEADGARRRSTAAQRELARQRSMTRQAVSRDRDALLPSEPDLPPDLVRGETLVDIDAATKSAPAQGLERVEHSWLAVCERSRGLQERMI